MQQPLPQADTENEREYRAIEAALLQTTRGRWFLAEHGRRARRVDGQMLEEAISRLQTSLREPPALLGQLKAEIEELKALVNEASEEVRAKPGAIDPQHGEQSAHGILKAAEDIHELAWKLHAAPPDMLKAERIASHAAQLYALSLQNAVESERLTKLAARLDDARRRLEALLETIAHESHASGDAVPLPQSLDH